MNADSEKSATSTSLLCQIKERDEAAWQRLVQIYGPLIYRLCRVAGVPPEDSKDIGQDVFRGIAASIDKFRYRDASDSFRAWVLGIMRNKIRDYYRQKGGQAAAVGGSDMQLRIQQIPNLEWTSSTDGTEFDPDSSMLQRAIQIVRGEFEFGTWDAFWQVTVDGRQPKDVAKQLGISTGAIYQAKSRVIRRLRRELEGMLE